MKKRISGWWTRVRLGAYSIPVALVAALAMITITELAYRAQRDALDQLVLEGQARLRLLNAFQRLTEAESGKRGYLLLGDVAYLKPYERATADVLDELKRVDEFDQSADPQTRELQARVRKAMQEKMTEMNEVMRLHDQGDVATAMELVRTGIGLEMMQKLRDEVQATMRYRNQHIAHGLDSVREIFLLGRIGVISLTALCTLVLIALISSSRAFEVEREQQRLALRDERDRLEQEVNRRMADLRELTQHLQTAREDERSRLARELHDELGALLTSAKLNVASMRPSLKQVPEVEPKLQRLVEALNAGIALKRRIIEDLSPSTLHSLGLQPALEILCSETARNCDIPIRCEFQPVQLSADKALAAYRFVQEALTNMAKYAQATSVVVRMQEHDGEARVEVWDNGKGFDASTLSAGRHGLRGMRFRFEALGGHLAIDSSASAGTRLTAWLPLDEQPAADAASPLGAAVLAA